MINSGFVPDKPFLTWEEQLKKIEEDYNLVCQDPEEGKDWIIMLSYYDLINGNRAILSNSSFDLTLNKLSRYTISDRIIRGFLVMFSGFVETTFKNILGNTLAKYYGVRHQDYLDLSLYKRNKNPDLRKAFVETINKLISRCTDQKETDQPIAHYIKTKNHIPPWILLKNTSFSDATTLFKHLDTKLKMEIISYYPQFDLHQNDPQKEITSFIEALNINRKYRNLATHNLNFMQYNKHALNRHSKEKLMGRLLTKEQLDKPLKSVINAVGSTMLLLHTPLAALFFSTFSEFVLKEDHKLIINAYGFSNDNIELIRNYKFHNK